VAADQFPFGSVESWAPGNTHCQIQSRGAWGDFLASASGR
jgi:hypothetical protein